MRSIKKLLELMLDNKDLFTTGLCMWNTKLYTHDIITWEEHCLLKNYISSNEPPFYDNFTIFKKKIFGSFPDGYYYWKCSDINPRIKWIQKHIAKNS